MLQRIFYEVGKQLHEKLAIALHLDAFLEHGEEGMVRLFGYGAVRIDHRLHRLAQVKGHKACAPRPCLDLSDAQKSAERLQDLVRLFDGLFNPAPVVADRRRLVARRLQLLPKSAEGVRRSCAMSFVTCRMPSISAWMRSSI